MFLSRVELGPRAASTEEFWREVSKPYGAHQALWRLFGRGPDQRRDFLYRAEDASPNPTFLVLSTSSPSGDGGGLWTVQSKPFAPSLRAGQRLGFRLRASPVVRRAPEAAGRGLRARRHDVVMDRKKHLAALGQPTAPLPDLIREAGLSWLERQAGRAGFRLGQVESEVIGDDGLLEAVARRDSSVRVDGYRQHRIVRRAEKPITFSSLDFEGVLEVAEPETFLARVAAGFGPQKAFGCGLMLLRRM
jgi:CRISPR system Cascade subunit CasE